MKKFLIKLVIAGAIFGAVYATLGVWLMWSDDPEFHSGKIATSSHLLWVTGYSVSIADIRRALGVYVICMSLGAIVLCFGGIVTFLFANIWKAVNNGHEPISNE